MWTRIIAWLAALLFIAFLVGIATHYVTTPANAEQQACGPWEEMLLYAANEYGEFPAFLATSDKGHVIVIAVNPDTGSFTVFAQPNESVACAVDSGKAWNEAPDSVIDNIRKKIGSET
jgi:hypothetical protein